jgi:DNA polymerase-3 subunit alpha
LLQDVKDDMIEKINITLSINDLDERTINELSIFIKNNPGKTQLYFKVMDGERHVSLNFFSKSLRVNVTRDLIDYINESENMDFSINKQDKLV